MTPQTPERCGQRYEFPLFTSDTYACSLAADHRSEFHLDMQALATWSRAGDLELHRTTAQAMMRGTPAIVSLQYDACGARLHVDRTNATREVRDRPQVDATYVCALGMAHGSMAHRSADGVQWGAAHHPDTAGTVMDVQAARHYAELVRLRREARDILCTGCPIVANSSNPEDGADIEPQPGCPVHGEVAELRRSLDWSAQQYDRIAAALGPEYVAPFGPDVTTEAVRRIELLAEYQATHG